MPPLVTFLPGAMLALGMKELAYGDMVSGSSRLTTGFVQLVLLAFGLAAGAVLVGAQRADLLEATVPLARAPWITVVGVSFYKWVTEQARWLRVQVARSGSVFRRRDAR